MCATCMTSSCHTHKVSAGANSRVPYHLWRGRRHAQSPSTLRPPELSQHHDVLGVLMRCNLPVRWLVASGSHAQRCTYVKTSRSMPSVSWTSSNIPAETQSSIMLTCKILSGVQLPAGPAPAACATTAAGHHCCCLLRQLRHTASPQGLRRAQNPLPLYNPDLGPPQTESSTCHSAHLLDTCCQVEHYNVQYIAGSRLQVCSHMTCLPSVHQHCTCS